MQIKNIVLLLLTAIIWGFAFTAQKSGMEHLEPIAFNCLRSYIGAIFLIPCTMLLALMKPKNEQTSSQPKRSFAYELFAGLCCGAVLAAASTAQQIGVKFSSAGKAGFITACYIILVPIFGLLLKKACSWLLWLAVALAVVAMYLLCMTDDTFSIGKGDAFVLLCAVLFALHIIVVDHFATRTDGVRLSCLQFFVVGLVLTPPMLVAEGLPTWASISACAIPLLYAGVMSCGIAYTLQILGQRDFNPTIASLLMSLESTFAVLGGWLLLGEQLSARQLIGCAIMFVAIILAQIPAPKRNEHNQP
ncbi:MAG: DMT family transporter [Oligosphaeraceae bacterium]